MTAFITINKGGPTDDIEDGVYPVVLTAISDPKTVTATRGPNAGKDVDLIDWDFAVDEGQAEGYEITATTSTASGPKSKMYAYLTALFGGKAPPVGTQLQKEHLVGRRWPRSRTTTAAGRSWPTWARSRTPCRCPRRRRDSQ
jgi:hypothetical protein